jgi:hypothetical protein
LFLRLATLQILKTAALFGLISMRPAALVGFGFGTWIGSVVAAVDARLKGAVLVSPEDLPLFQLLVLLLLTLLHVFCLWYPDLTF